MCHQGTSFLPPCLLAGNGSRPTLENLLLIDYVSVESGNGTGHGSPGNGYSPTVDTGPSV